MNKHHFYRPATLGKIEQKQSKIDIIEEYSFYLIEGEWMHITYRPATLGTVEQKQSKIL